MLVLCVLELRQALWNAFMPKLTNLGESKKDLCWKQVWEMILNSFSAQMWEGAAVILHLPPLG